MDQYHGHGEEVTIKNIIKVILLIAFAWFVVPWLIDLIW